MLAGWEGSANDFTVLKGALSLPPPYGLRLYEGKYYLCDAGYTTMPGFLSLYRSVRYHLEEQTGCTPKNREELFNLCTHHSGQRVHIWYFEEQVQDSFCEGLLPIPHARGRCSCLHSLA